MFLETTLYLEFRGFRYVYEAPSPLRVLFRRGYMALGAGWGY